MAVLTIDSLDFHVTEHGRGEPLVLLHGFTGSAESWWPVIDSLAARHRVIAVDLIGHGQTAAPDDPDRYRFGRALDDLAAIAAQLGIAHAAWLGYSMGGRLALGLALRHPRLVSALVLESATPGIADPAEREARCHADETLATWIEEAGMAAFVDRWERLPLWASQQQLPEETSCRQREIRLRNLPIGLANSLRGMGQGRQPSLWTRLGEIAVTVLLIAGEDDEKFATIAAQMNVRIADSTLVIVPHAGHAIHLEQPVVHADLVLDFLGASSDFGVEPRKDLHA